MKTILLLCMAVAWAVAGAAQAGAADARDAYANEANFPVPPIPPDRPPSSDAPMPNRDAAAPLEPARRTRVTLDSDINHRDAPVTGAGAAPGALYKLDNDRRFFVLPGLMMHIPLP